MAYPSSIDAPSTTMQGTTLVATDDHALDHRSLGSAVISIENKLGIGSGSAAANQILVGQSAGQSTWGSVWNSAQLGTPNITSGTMNNGTLGTPAITGGTGNAMTLGTPVMNHFTSSGTTVPTTADRALAPTMSTVSDSAGGTITINAPSAQIFEIVLGTTAGNRTLGTPTNPADGMFLGYRIKQNTNNTGTLVFSAIFLQNSNGTPTLGTQSSWNYLGFRYHAGDVKWHSQGNSLQII